jgi:thiamine-phosphate pyrophosphorylase
MPEATPLKPITTCFLYGILDLGYVADREVAPMTSLLVAGGVDILQLRAKSRSKREIADFARTMLPVTKAAGVPLIINDHPDLLREVSADGCHLGQEDAGIAEARDMAGRLCIVGKSTHNLEQARLAQQEGADYIGFGPLFPTPTKPSAVAVGLAGLAELHQKIELPVFCIGGVKLANLDEVIRSGARRVCIVSDLLCAPDVLSRTSSVKASLGASGQKARFVPRESP